MNFFIKPLFILALAFMCLLANDEKTITIGVTPNPFEPLMSYMKEDFKAKGYELKIIEFTDYILPNRALENKELDANLYQHKPFLDEYNKERNTKLIPITPVIIAPIGIYSHKIKSLKELQIGAKVAIPNDPTNESRALELLEKAGYIILQKNKTLKTPLDIKDNPKNLQFIELKAAQLPRALNDVDIAVINSNYALDSGLSPSNDTLFKEDKDSPYVNYVVVRSEDKDSQKIKILDEILRSDKLRTYINENYKDILIPAF